MIQANTYFLIRRNQTNLSEANWVTVVNLVKQIVGVNGLPNHKLHWRGNLDTFVLDDVTYSNEYIFEALFPVNAVSFEAFKNKLVNAFNVDPALVTYTTGALTIEDRPSAFATYRYQGTIRMYLGLFGWADEDSPCTWEESRVEAVNYIIDRIAEWEQ